MAGAQIAWTVELGYGTPFLLSLGVSEQLTSLVWLAGPISGLIAQPLIGAISDSSTSKYRRRYWIVSSTIVLVVSTLTLAYCKEISGFLVDLFGGGQGDWDPKRSYYVSNTAIGLAIVSFYLLDFALNALQASLRNLLLDITPAGQLNAGNAWHSRMTQAGNIIGYGFGFFPLADIPILRWIGGTQFRKFCIVALTVLVVTVWITCWTQQEHERPKRQSESSQMKKILGNIRAAILKLPPPIKKVCAVQVFAFMGWFPFLFYATTYIGQAMAKEKNAEPDPEYATRVGALSMLFNSVVAALAGTLLPYLSRRDTRLLRVQDEDEEEETTRLRNAIHEWRVDAAKKGEKMRLPTLPVLYRTIWIGALLLFTFFDDDDFLRHNYRWSNHPRQFDRCLLGCRLLGSIRNYYGVPQRDGRDR
jgi:solute carrier family 45 protein 1/2/4